MRLGGTKTLRVDVRIIAATNTDLEDLIRQKLFRKDLYYRLNVIKIELPPLRDRRDDIPLLIKHFLDFYAKENAKAREPHRTGRRLRQGPGHHPGESADLPAGPRGSGGSRGGGHPGRPEPEGADPDLPEAPDRDDAQAGQGRPEDRGLDAGGQADDAQRDDQAPGDRRLSVLTLGPQSVDLPGQAAVRIDLDAGRMGGAGGVEFLDGPVDHEHPPHRRAVFLPLQP